ncbi:MAG: ABC transporter substrate-binding protein [Acidimicrobiales bacterium]
MRPKPNRFLVALVAAIFVAGCASDGNKSKVTPARQDLVIGASADTFNTTGDKANLGMFPFNANIFEGLVRATPTYQVEPALAERWAYRGNNTWRFFLRKGVTFHNGAAFNAAAVKFSLDRLTRSGVGTIKLGPDSTKVIDDFTVDITPAVPDLRLVDQLTHPSVAPMIAPGTEPGTNPVGTGPFKFVSYTKGDRLVVERYDGYWGAAAKLKTLTFRFIPDDNTRWLAFKTGSVDLIYDLPRQLLGEARKTPGVEAVLGPPGAAEIMDLNRSGAPPYDLLGDLALRKAVAMAIDRKTLVDRVFLGSAEVSNTITPAALLGPSASLVTGVAHDTKAAEAMLDSAGWKVGPDGVRVKDGHRLSLTIINGYPPIDLRKPMPELVQAELKDVGIDSKIVETPELATYSARLDKGEGDIFMERVAQNDTSPTQFAAGFYYSKASPPYSKWFSAGPGFDSLLEGALATPDRAEADKLTAEALREAVDRQVVVIPVAAVNWLWAMKPGIQGFVGAARHVRWAPVSWK